MKSTIRVMLVDDREMVRTGFRLLLEQIPGIRVVAESASGDEASRHYDEAAPDVVVIDMSDPDVGGIDAVHALLASHGQARILVLTPHSDPSSPRRALRAGALGYLSKRAAPQDLIDAVRDIAEGRRFLDAATARSLAARWRAGQDDPVDRLTDREFEVFLQLANGRSVSDIAATYGLSPGVMGSHLCNIKSKLGVATSTELAMVAVRSGLVER